MGQNMCDVHHSFSESFQTLLTQKVDCYLISNVLAVNSLKKISQLKYSALWCCWCHGNNLNPFEWASTITKKVWPWKGPARSILILCQTQVGHTQRCSGTGCGLLPMLWQLPQEQTVSSISLSIPGHQTCNRASDFMLTIPGWPVCNSSSTVIVCFS